MIINASISEYKFNKILYVTYFRLSFPIYYSGIINIRDELVVRIKGFTKPVKIVKSTFWKYNAT